MTARNVRQLVCPHDDIAGKYGPPGSPLWCNRCDLTIGSRKARQLAVVADLLHLRSIA